MDPSFWHDRWAANEIGFHQSEVNRHLAEHLTKLPLPTGARVFVPLCGKTLDIAWLLSQGFRVVAAELSRMAIEQLFVGLGCTPRISGGGKLEQFSFDEVDVYVGNIFDLSIDILGHVDAIYDRAALVALPPEMRARYAQHLMSITGRAPQLLISFEYDQSVMEGPPFSVTGEEIRRHYAADYQITPLATAEVPGGLKGRCPASESVFLLQRKAVTSV
jgi:thiopurine S-methyltransferase